MTDSQREWKKRRTRIVVSVAVCVSSLPLAVPSGRSAHWELPCAHHHCHCQRWPVHGERTRWGTDNKKKRENFVFVSCSVFSSPCHSMFLIPLFFSCVHTVVVGVEGGGGGSTFFIIN